MPDRPLQIHQGAMVRISHWQNTWKRGRGTTRKGAPSAPRLVGRPTTPREVRKGLLEELQLKPLGEQILAGQDLLRDLAVDR